MREMRATNASASVTGTDVGLKRQAGREHCQRLGRVERRRKEGEGDLAGPVDGTDWLRRMGVGETTGQASLYLQGCTVALVGQL